MVTKRPTVPAVDTTSQQLPPPADLPYPTTPILPRSAKTTASVNSVYSPDLATSPAFNLVDMHQARQRRGGRTLDDEHCGNDDDDNDSTGTWDTDGEGNEDTPEDEEARKKKMIAKEAAIIPPPLRFSPSKQRMVQHEEGTQHPDIPASLQPGGVSGRAGEAAKARPRRSMESQGYADEEANANPWVAESVQQRQESVQQPQQLQHPQMHSNNPYRQPHTPQQLGPPDGLEGNTSQAAWEDVRPPHTHAPPSQPPPPPPQLVELSALQSPATDLPMRDQGEFAASGMAEPPQTGRPLPPGTTAALSRRPHDIGDLNGSPPYYPDDNSSNPWDQESSASIVPSPPPPGLPPKAPLSQPRRQQQQRQQQAPSYELPSGPPSLHIGTLIDRTSGAPSLHPATEAPPIRTSVHAYASKPSPSTRKAVPPSSSSISPADERTPYSLPASPPVSPLSNRSTREGSAGVVNHPQQPQQQTPSQPRQQEQPTPQRAEHYQIKHIRLHHHKNTSPILLQNANGPCPLLALVNAMILRTPSGVDTALTETLRSRETVSLGLLLDAVFDELVTSRTATPSVPGRGREAEGEADVLPDVTELYAFLLALHEGMNVNPRLISSTPSSSAAAVHGQSSLSLRSSSRAGDFEQTREMRLYGTFRIPLLHGWTAEPGSAAYSALTRLSAPTFEQAQDALLREPELEAKARLAVPGGGSGLSFEEEALLEDVRAIGQFVREWPTQLTECGLKGIKEELKEGEVAILFRNDHFSTLMKEPGREGGLCTLVTDEGYARHAGVVWERLVDVRGAGAEFLSGDFAVVSSEQEAEQEEDGEGWQTVGGRRASREQNGEASLPAGNAAARRIASSSSDPPPLPGPRPAGTNAGLAPSTLSSTGGHARSASEQEDHDLALALQLQEEEEEADRQAAVRRRHEQDLSERFLSTQQAGPNSGNNRSHRNSNDGPGDGPRPQIPPRRSNNPSAGAAATLSSRPGVNRPAQSADPDAPPSYEQSASDRVYRPGRDGQGPRPLNAREALIRAGMQQGQGMPMAGQGLGPQRGQGGRAGGRRTSGLVAGAGGGVMPGGFPGTQGPGGVPQQGQRGGQLTTGRQEEEDRCVVM